MKAEYDFSKAKENPYANRLKPGVTIRLDEPAGPEGAPGRCGRLPLKTDDPSGS
jgi:hypothetical protein